MAAAREARTAEGLEGQGQALIGSDRSLMPDVAVLARGRWKDSRRRRACADVLQVQCFWFIALALMRVFL